MTLIIGHETDDGFIIAADSGMTDGGELIPMNTIHKIHRNGDLVMGVAGSLLAGIHIHYGFDAPEYGDNNPHLYLVRQFAPKLRESLIDARIMKEDAMITDNGDKFSFGILIGVGNRIFVMNDWLSFYDCNRGIMAIGTGNEYAKGVIESCKLLLKPYEPLKACEMALRIASEHDKGVSAPFHAIIKRDGKFEEITL